MAESVESWVEFNHDDMVLCFHCFGGPRDGVNLATVWDREQARSVYDSMKIWFDHPEMFFDPKGPA